MILARYRYRKSAAAVLFGALLIAFAILAIAEHAAHADPVAPVVAAGIDLTSIATIIIGVLVAGGVIAGYISAALHWLAPRTKTTFDDRAAVGFDVVRTDIAEVLSAVQAIPGVGTIVHELAPAAPAAPVSPVTVNVHPPAVPPAAPPVASALGVTTIAALLLFVGLATGAGSGCAASTRADTLQAAAIVVSTARSGLLEWEPAHELELAKSGTPDQAAAALAAYRAKRAIANKAFVAAVDAIVLANGLNDQLSLDAVAAAIALVILDYKQLKGMP